MTKPSNSLSPEAIGAAMFAVRVRIKHDIKSQRRRPNDERIASRIMRLERAYRELRQLAIASHVTTNADPVFDSRYGEAG